VTVATAVRRKLADECRDVYAACVQASGSGSSTSVVRSNSSSSSGIGGSSSGSSGGSGGGSSVGGSGNVRPTAIDVSGPIQAHLSRFIDTPLSMLGERLSDAVVPRWYEVAFLEPALDLLRDLVAADITAVGASEVRALSFDHH
jgi:hypothetical protein